MEYEMITFTTKALERLKLNGAGDGTFVRILVKSGGCSGMTYDAEIDSTMQPGEKLSLPLKIFPW